MSTRDMADRKATNAATISDLVRLVAARSGDPDATYEGFVLGRETSLAYGSRSPGRVTTPDQESAKRRPAIRKAPPPVTVSDADFPTEWTLKP